MTLTETPAGFKSWLARARRGEGAIYACRAGTIAPLGQKTAAAEEAWRAHLAGLVILCQRKMKTGHIDGGGVFDYIAVRR